MAPEFPKDAFHNDAGMYVSPDPKVAHPDFLEHGETGILIPKPQQKQVRYVDFELTGSTIRYECTETIEQIQEMWRDASDVQGRKTDWYTLTDPVYETPILIPFTAMSRVCGIIDGFKDMEAVKQQIEIAEHAKRVNAMQLTQARFDTAAAQQRQAKQFGKKHLN